jgi:IclR family acetate operon transcriptional repressor
MSPRGSPTHNAAASPVERVFDVLELVSRIGLVSATDIVNVLGLPRPTAHRLLAKLEQLDLLQISPFKGKFGPSNRLITLSTSMFSTNAAYLPIKTLLLTLSQKTGESHHISLLTDGQVHFFDHTERADSRTLLNPGLKAPLHCTAAGRLFLAAMTDDALQRFLMTGPWEAFTSHTITTPEALYPRILEARRQGFAVVESEYAQELIVGAVPIRNPRQKVVAVLGLHTSSRRSSVTQVTRLIPAMQNQALRIGRLL